VVGDAFQVVNHQSRPHPPLGRNTASIGRVGYEVERLGVEEIYLVVFRLEVAGALYVETFGCTPRTTRPG
jgi:hypothetical protein